MDEDEGEDEASWFGDEEIDPAELVPDCFLGGKKAVIEVDGDSVSVWLANAAAAAVTRKGAAPQLMVSMSELAAVSMRTALQQSVSKLCGGNDSPSLVLHTFKRRQLDWLPMEHSIDFDDERMAAGWARHIQDRLDAQPQRPRRLFVVINPYGGHRRADQVWQDLAKPIFERAHIQCDAFRTGYGDHAVELITGMKWEQFASYDGIVAIGGDGLFQECLRGVLALRAKGGEWMAKARDIRLAQIPAGSTDAVACTVNGSRLPVTAALHVVLGDRSPLDVLEVRTAEGELRYACSTASYGFIGDVLERSENMRWMGPARYDIGGAMTFLRLKPYPVRISYRQPAKAHPARTVCCTMCKLCSAPSRHVFDSESELSALDAASEATTSVSGPRSRSHSHTPSIDTAGDAAAAAVGGGMGLVPQGSVAAPRPPGTYHARGASGLCDGTFQSWNVAAASAAAAHCSCGVDAAAAPPSATGDDLPRCSSDGWFGRLSAREHSGDSRASNASSSEEEGRWRVWEGEISSLMVVVTSTRSDKSKNGILPHAHMSDGRLHLVIVRKCSRVQFLRFLLGLSWRGVDDSLDFVDVKEVEAFRMEELEPERSQSFWNVDGELLKSRFVSARCHHGLIEVFSRGPECC